MKNSLFALSAFAAFSLAAAAANASPGIGPVVPYTPEACSLQAILLPAPNDPYDDEMAYRCVSYGENLGEIILIQIPEGSTGVTWCRALCQKKLNNPPTNSPIPQ